VPRCFRVPLQPGLGGQNSVSFLGLQGAETVVHKPDCSGHPDLSIVVYYFGMLACFTGFIGIKRKAGLQASMNYCMLISKS